MSSLMSSATLDCDANIHLSFQVSTTQYLCPDLQNCQSPTVHSVFSWLMAVVAVQYESLHNHQMKSSWEPISHLH